MTSKTVLETIADEPARAPYAAEIQFLLRSDIQLALHGPACLISKPDAVVRLSEARDQRVRPFAGAKRYTLSIEGFAKAADAETSGMKLAMAALWAAISKRFTLRLEYHTPLPCVVYNRTRPTNGSSMMMEGFGFWPETVSEFSELINEILVASAEPRRELVLAMELFAATQLETTQRARFINMISSLEPLAEQKDLPPAVQNFVTDMEQRWSMVDFSGIPEALRDRLGNSMTGRLNELKRESIRQALLRMIRATLPADPAAEKLIDESYTLRSNMLHEGATDPYLDRRVADLEKVIRRVFASRIGATLRTPA